eukprot:10242-Eustigmatos_ZCMA.PRE.1
MNVAASTTEDKCLGARLSCGNQASPPRCQTTAKQPKWDMHLFATRKPCGRKTRACEATRLHAMVRIK